jgi:hypothetical protein
MGVVVDLSKRLLKSYSSSKALEKRERFKVQHRVSKALRAAFRRGAHAEHHLGIVAVLELLEMGYAVESVQIDLVYSLQGDVVLNVRASISNPRGGRVIELRQLHLPFE